jgi:hypothetical protein
MRFEALTVATAQWRYVCYHTFLYKGLQNRGTLKSTPVLSNASLISTCIKSNRHSNTQQITFVWSKKVSRVQGTTEMWIQRWTRLERLLPSFQVTATHYTITAFEDQIQESRGRFDHDNRGVHGLRQSKLESRITRVESEPNQRRPLWRISTPARGVRPEDAEQQGHRPCRISVNWNSHECVNMKEKKKKWTIPIFVNMLTPTFGSSRARGSHRGSFSEVPSAPRGSSRTGRAQLLQHQRLCWSNVSKGTSKPFPPGVQFKTWSLR